MTEQFGEIETLHIPCQRDEMTIFLVRSDPASRTGNLLGLIGVVIVSAAAVVRIFIRTSLCGDPSKPSSTSGTLNPPAT